MLQVEKVELVYRLPLYVYSRPISYMLFFFLNLFLFLPAQCNRRSHHSFDLYVFAGTAAWIDPHTIAFAGYTIHNTYFIVTDSW